MTVAPASDVDNARLVVRCFDQNQNTRKRRATSRRCAFSPLMQIKPCDPVAKPVIVDRYERGDKIPGSTSAVYSRHLNVGPSDFREILNTRRETCEISAAFDLLGVYGNFYRGCDVKARRINVDR